MKSVIREGLLDAAADGDRERFDRLFDVWFHVVYAVAMRYALGDRQRAESLTHSLLIDWVQEMPSPRRLERRVESTSEGFKRIANG